MKKLLILVLFAPVIAFAQWSAPVSISPRAMNASMNENMGPGICSSHDTLHVIWSDHRTKGYAIYYTRSTDSGITWSNSVAITDTMGSATMPSLAVSGRNIHVVWWDTVKKIACSCYEHSVDGGNTWSNRLVIDSNTVYWPGVAVAGSTVLVSIDKEPLSRTTVFLAISKDNGNSFSAEQQISTPTTGTGRSEDQGTATDGKNIYMCWNDNRNSPTTLEIYYRRSRDMGKTWDPEIQISNAASYSPMIYCDSAKVYVALGFSSPLNSYIAESTDSGATFSPIKQVTTNVSTNADAYPSMVVDGPNLYMTTHIFPTKPWTVSFTQSSDGGATWSKEIQLGDCNGTSFMVLTCPMLHVVWPNNGSIYYSRNPTAAPSCPTTPTGIESVNNTAGQIFLYPNPVQYSATVVFDGSGTHAIEVYDITGRKISSYQSVLNKYTFLCNELSPGMYFVKIITGNNAQVVKFIKQ